MTTLLIFALAPETEQRRRQLLPTAYADVERGLHRYCLEQVVAAGLDLGWRVSVCSPEPLSLPPSVCYRKQGRGSFGERLARLLALEEQGGASPLVLVGSDCPALATHHLREAASALAEDPSRIVIGPSRDGGFYLLAAAQPVSPLLSAVAWRSPRARATLIAACRQAGRPLVFLAPLDDLDRPRDLERLVARGARLELGWRSLVAGVARIFAVLRRPRIAPILRPPRLTAAGARLSRAPPDFSLL